MTATRALSPAKLKELVSNRIATARAFGVRLMEAKSGYGLSLASELAALKGIKAAAREHPTVTVVATCMAAHS